MQISVMYITRDRKHELLRSLQSCIEKRIDSMEIVIVDNASENPIEEELKILFEKSGIRYQYIFSEYNLGVSGGRNLAFSKCQGEYVVCLDDDTIIESNNFFECIYHRMSSNSEIMAAALKIYEPEADRYLEGISFRKQNYTGRQVYSYIGAGHVLRRDVFKGMHLYPDKLMYGSEELYVALRIHQQKKVLAYFEDICILHLPSKINRVVSDERKINILVNTYLIRKYFYPRYFYPVLTFMLVFRIARHSLHKDKKYIKKAICCRWQNEYKCTMNITEFKWNLTRIPLRYLF